MGFTYIDLAQSRNLYVGQIEADFVGAFPVDLAVRLEAAHRRELQHPSFDIPARHANRLHEHLENCLSVWPDDDRALIEKKYMESWSYRELAVKYNVTEKSIEGRLARLRRKLKECLLDQLKHEGTVHP